MLDQVHWFNNEIRNRNLLEGDWEFVVTQPMIRDLMDLDKRNPPNFESSSYMQTLFGYDVKVEERGKTSQIGIFPKHKDQL